MYLNKYLYGKLCTAELGLVVSSPPPQQDILLDGDKVENNNRKTLKHFPSNKQISYFKIIIYFTKKMSSCF